jgi:DNA-binding NtrC family response regulator
LNAPCASRSTANGLRDVEGLRVLEQLGPFALVVSDMQMLAMDGVQLLSQGREGAPDTVRVIFSGQAGLQATIAAVKRAAFTDS